MILGTTNQAWEDNRNVARMAALLAGFPVEVGGVTVNRLCATGLQAIMDTSAGGRGGFRGWWVESMSRAPYVMSKPKSAFSRGPSNI